MIEPECIFVPYPNLNTEDKERVQFRDFLVSKNGVAVFNIECEPYNVVQTSGGER